MQVKDMWMCSLPGCGAHPIMAGKTVRWAMAGSLRCRSCPGQMWMCLSIKPVCVLAMLAAAMDVMALWALRQTRLAEVPMGFSGLSPVTMWANPSPGPMWRRTVMPVLSKAVMRWDVSHRGWLGAMTVQSLARGRPSEVLIGARGWH